MLKQILGVGGWTLASRVAGLVRDIVIAAVLGSGVMYEAFAYAFRLPNHFRAIFGEGAFNAAYVPSFAKAEAEGGTRATRQLVDSVFTLLLGAQAIILVLAWIYMPTLVRLIAPGLSEHPEEFELVVTLTRITFPYLLLITLVTQHTATLNALHRFGVGAAAPILLNVSLVLCVALAFLFPSAAHAAAFGVTLSGVLQLIVLMVATKRADAFAIPHRPVFDERLKGFFRRLGPATIGTAGLQIAIFADTALSSLLGQGAMASIYNAERLYQLPIGVIGIAAGTVLLSEVSRRIAQGDIEGAVHAQNRAMGWTLMLAAPFVVAFLLIPDLIVAALLVHGRFHLEAAEAAGTVLSAYAIGLPAVVLIRSAVSSFQGRGDTKTPMLVSLGAVAVNVPLKFLLTPYFGASGLALATSAGAWTNFLALHLLAHRQGVSRADRAFAKTFIVVLAASAALAAAILICDPLLGSFTATLAHFQRETRLAGLVLIGGVAYAGVLATGARICGFSLRR
ncbi:MAG: murein biosynthesis integral membrane protein MurJ [Hyphomicrobiales bacterium]|nr:murein biosynthesis integral membrane protein MurJ [Hyphomicrobiales bacterium]MBV9051414.1 murein biosynthesis integral membrane protein MurJ [Hyphomicrobiales bacterium]MBV9588622.1 murein biosynthesis integral membrane protein MurJ [Hyphomicrobiales bacterium]MBV9974269.1 murein biosynthesis integral membrane protein MurJ [Hyphomicrobiales bacterium]